MLQTKSGNTFKKDVKILLKRKYDFQKLQHVVSLLAKQKTLPLKYKAHNLSGEYSKYQECHIEPNWILIYKIEEEIKFLYLFFFFIHRDLFK